MPGELRVGQTVLFRNVPCRVLAVYRTPERTHAWVLPEGSTMPYGIHADSCEVPDA